MLREKNIKANKKKVTFEIRFVCFGKKQLLKILIDVETVMGSQLA